MQHLSNQAIVHIICKLYRVSEMWSTRDVIKAECVRFGRVQCKCFLIKL